jgi:hypothetical protein
VPNERRIALRQKAHPHAVLSPLETSGILYHADGSPHQLRKKSKKARAMRRRRRSQ